MNQHDLPALLGGTAACPNGPPNWPCADPDVFARLQRAYDDGSWGRYHGGNCEELEVLLRAFFGCEHVLLCGSGSYAVELALRALRIGPGDEVILAAYDYPGNFLAIHAVGAEPVLIDLDPDNWNLAPALIEAAKSPRTRAILVSHLHGGLVSMSALTEIARRLGLLIIEDAAQAAGAWIEGKRAGTWGDVGILSFGGSKLLTAGRGGALLSANPTFAQRARTELLRGNLTCPLSELQAAVLIPQVHQLDRRHEHRLAQAQALTTMLDELPGVRPFANHLVSMSPAYFKLGLQFDSTLFGLSRARLVETMRAEGVALSEGFPAAHVGRSPRRWRRGSDLKEAERAHEGCVVLHHPVLLGSQDDIEAVSIAWHKIHHHAAALS